VADEGADVPVVAMSLLRRVPMFVPLPRPALEVVARSAVEVPVLVGEAVITQGAIGDRFYTVASGTFDVSRDDHHLDSVGRGGSFGELALLTDAPRAATVTAREDGSLLAIERSPFLVAVTGHDSCRQAAWGAVRRYGGHVEDAGEAGQVVTPPADDDAD
jgi:CRP-like cAMP-binding protein